MQSSRDRYFEPASEHIVHKVIDDELMVINLENGFYYSADGLASGIWQSAVGGRNEGAILEDLAVAYPGQPELETHVSGFLDQLLQHGLVKQVPTPRVGDAGPVSWPERYAPPKIDCHDDVAQIVAMDPPLPVMSSEGRRG